MQFLCGMHVAFRESMKVSGGVLLLTILFGAGVARAADASPESGDSEAKHVPGGSGLIELNALAGTFIGLRLKGIIHPASSWDLVIEGLTGDSTFTADGSSFRLERGAGIRAELPLTSFGRSAAFIAPGADVMYLPRAAPERPAIISVFNYSGRDPATVLVPNAEFTVLTELARHACLLAGLRGGAVLTLSGHDASGRSMVGALRPEASLFIGARF